MQIKKNIRKMHIAGPAGVLEGIYYHSVHNSRSVALLAHSSPKEHENTRYKGNMNEEIIKYLFYVCKLRQISVLRFNMRGVESSSGTFQDLQQGMEDASICFDWLQEVNPGAEKFWPIGYSGGAWIAAQIAMRRPSTGGFICIGPRAGKTDFSFLAPLVPGFMIHAGRNSAIRRSQIDSLIEATQKRCKDKIEHHIMEDADESFKDYRRELVQKVDKFLDKHGAGVPPVARIE